MELQFGTKIESLQSDWGGEYRAFQQMLLTHTITHGVSCPHTYEQNCLVERKQRYIVDNGLTLLANASIPLKFWDEAFRTVVFLINRQPTPTLAMKYPLEVLFITKPAYSLLKVFGCGCYPNLRPYNKQKFAFRSAQCTFLGHSFNHKGYKCLDSSGRVFISRDVVFDELSFPFSTCKNSAPNNMN